MVGSCDEGLARLVERCLRGDDRAWGHLVARFQRLVFSVAKRSGLSDEDAEDVFQSTFLSLHRSLDKIESPETLPKWLSVTAARESYRLRRLANRVGTLGDGRTLDDIVAEDDHDAEMEAVRAVQAEIVRSATEALPERCRDLVSRLYYQESSYQEVSESAGIPVGAIGPTRARCLEKLRRILEDRGFFDEPAYYSEALHPSSLT